MISSFLIYFSVFIVSSLACCGYDCILDRTSNPVLSNENKNVIRFPEIDLKKIVCILLVLAPPVFISTFRALDVGTDTNAYLSIYNSNKIYNLFQYLELYGTWNHSYEIGFQQILRLSYVLGGGFNLVKLLCSFLTIFFVWRGSVYYHKKFQISSGMCMFFFYLLEFSYSLNGTRYSIALSLFFYGFQFVIEKKLVKYLVCCFFMMMFHMCLIFAIAFYLVNFFGSWASERSFKYVSFATIGALFVFLRPLVDNALPLIEKKILRFSSYSVEMTADYGFGVLLILILYLIPLIRWNEFLRLNVAWAFVLISCLTFIPFRFLGYFCSWLIRLSMIPEILFCVLYSCIPMLPVDKFEKFAWRVYTVMLLFVTYIFTVVVQNHGEVYPYTFDFTNYI